MRRYGIIVLCAALSSLFQPTIVAACAVCMGNRDSALVKGAEAGVLLMVLVTYTVLLSFAGMTAFWFVRARRAGRSRPIK